MFHEIRERIDALLEESSKVWGFVSKEWLAEQVRRFGPQTHHIQLRAAIVLRDNGQRAASGYPAEGRAGPRSEKLLIEQRRELRKQGYLAGGDGSNTSLQAVPPRLARKHPDLHFPLTETNKYSAARDARQFTRERNDAHESGIWSDDPSCE